MSGIHGTPGDVNELRDALDGLRSMSERGSEVRRLMETNPRQAVEMAYEKLRGRPRSGVESLPALPALPDEIRIHEDSATERHFVIPIDPNRELGESALSTGSSGGGIAGSIGTTGTASTLGTLPSCASSGSTVGSLSTLSSS